MHLCKPMTYQIVVLLEWQSAFYHCFKLILQLHVTVKQVCWFLNAPTHQESALCRTSSVKSQMKEFPVIQYSSRPVSHQNGMLRCGYPCLNFNNTFELDSPSWSLRKLPDTDTIGSAICSIHLFKVSCACCTVCEELTRHSAVRSRIAVLYLCLKIYIMEKGGLYILCQIESALCVQVYIMCEAWSGL